MQPDAARRLITDTLDREYDESNVRRFVQNLLVEVDMKQKEHRSGQMIYESFREHVASYKRLAKYTDPNGEEIDVLAVKLKTPHKLERARTMQRNFAATYLKDPDRHGREAALAAYYADGTDDWRLSFVRMEYRTVVDEETGDVKAEQELTPVRYTFLVGKNEPSHTPKRQFVPLLQSEELPFPPTLDEVKKAFDVEVVTEEFFEEYREHYKTLTRQVESALDEDDTAREEFEDKGVTADAFAEKLMGQLVFLYFLQKKGWLGVDRRDDWGEGPGNFLRQLYEGEYVEYDNFYQDLLEPLFYDALATDRGSGNYFGRLDCRIPFLNGGLFQPINDVERARVRLPLPNETFGDIFDTFDRYNFTVREDEPLEKEVAVDPEMLGKVFEKMLDADQRKEKGAFYTPRDVVHYMCQQSLIDHLDTELNVREAPLRPPEPQQQNAFGGPPQQGVLTEDGYNPQVKRAHLEALVRDGANWIEHDTQVRDDETTGGKYSEFEAPRPVVKHARAIDAVLSDVRICDPAVGSGAFPVGLMQEIVQVRRVLDTYIDDATDRSAYALKRHAIQHSLHGVDIDPSAIDIARLRLWLSLVVDEEDFEDIRPLPNLRYKIVRGDALQAITHHLENNEREVRLHDLMGKYVSASHQSDKERLESKINALLGDLLGEEDFDFRLYFGTVFEEQGGFDVVIGNPPYVRHENQSVDKDTLKSRFWTYKSSADLYVYFIERGMELLRPNGTFCYIVNNKWMRASYGESLREWLKSRDIVELIDFGDTPVFPGTTVYPCILRIQKDDPEDRFWATEIESLEYRKEGTLAAKVAQDGYPVKRKSMNDEGWALVSPETQDLLDSISSTGKRLIEYLPDKIYYGIKTGLNKAFVIDEPRRDEIVDVDSNSAKFIHPFLSGKNVSRYEPVSSDEYVIVIPSGWTDAHSDDAEDKWNWLQDELPGIANHLEEYEEQAHKRHDQGEHWWELRSCRYYDKFETTKILFPDLSQRGDFSIDSERYYAANTIYMIPEAGKYLLGILNSTLMTFYYANHFSVYRGGYLRFFTQYVERLPIYDIDVDDVDDVAARDTIVDYVNTMLDLHVRRADATTDAERDQLLERIEEVDEQIDQQVYSLYDLNDEEIALIEDSIST